MPTHWKHIASGLIAATALVALAACGDDDPTPTPTPAPTEVAAGVSAEFCSAVVAFDAVDSPGGEENEAEYVAAIVDYASNIEAPLAALTAAAPAELADATAALNGLFAQLHDGSIEAYENPESLGAFEQIEAAGREGCGWQAVSVTAQDYEFSLGDAPISAGPISFEMTNNGAEPHVFLLIRKPEGDTRESGEVVGEFLEKISSGDPAQIGEVVDQNVSGGGPFAIPGGSGSHVLDLSAGTYIYWCPIPQGESGEGPPHFALGMVGEFAVN
ncbi:MAG: hypothetical protein O3A10_00470 [Chloroflexi bacterium]|nr:hypothetical protein [Chloroflexota bacterium]MDA1145431.1 hypothetical protein [Chloroflexota bacterium]